MAFTRERAFAKTFLAGLEADEDVQREIVYTIQSAIERYDTGPYENRFVIGGVVEQVIGSAARALGMDIDNVGARLQGYDLELRGAEGLSVKYQSGLYSRSTKVRIGNSQGQEAKWERGTLFVQTGVGIGYSDPELTPGITVPASDKKSLDVCLWPLLSFWGFTPRAVKGPPPAWFEGLPTFPANPRYFVRLDIPDRPEIRAPRLVSDPIAKDLMSSGRTPRLLAGHKDSR